MTKTYLSAGYELANINDCGDVTPGESLPFMPVAPSGVGNLVGRMRDLRLSRFPGHLDRAGEYPANEVSWKRRIGPIAKNSRKTRFAA